MHNRYTYIYVYICIYIYAERGDICMCPISPNPSWTPPTTGGWGSPSCPWLVGSGSVSRPEFELDPTTPGRGRAAPAPPLSPPAPPVVGGVQLGFWPRNQAGPHQPRGEGSPPPPHQPRAGQGAPPHSPPPLPRPWLLGSSSDSGRKTEPDPTDRGRAGGHPIEGPSEPTWSHDLLYSSRPRSTRLAIALRHFFDHFR